MKVIGIHHEGYPTLRNIAQLPFTHYKVKRVYDMFTLPRYLSFKLGETPDWLLNIHQDFGISNCDILHFFNTVSFSPKPWITTFETAVPRWGDLPKHIQELGVKQLQGEHCRQIIALSESAKQIQTKLLKTHFPACADEILAKLCVMHPPQKLGLQSIAEKHAFEELSFIFVGADFFRKGGKAMLEAFAEFWAQGFNAHLYVVSSLKAGDYATHATQEDVLWVEKFLKTHQGKIFHFHTLPNSDVLALLQRCHVAILPSFADTYGYFVLEAQANACPVITTDIRAFPEINNQETGWVLHVEKDEFGNAKMDTPERCIAQQENLRVQILATIQNIVQNPISIQAKAEQSLLRIKKEHCPVIRARELEQLYDSVLLHVVAPATY